MSDEKIAGAPAETTPQDAGQTDDAAQVEAKPDKVETKPEATQQQLDLAKPEAEPRKETKPAPAKSTVAQAVSGDADRLAALEARMTEEVDAMKSARLELETRARQERDRMRLSYLRDIGATGALSDVNLLSLAPDHDPATAEGRVELDKWREANGGLFEAKGLSGVQVAEDVISKVPASKHGTFGPRIAKKIASDMFGGG